MKQLRLAGSSEFFNYRKFSVATTTTIEDADRSAVGRAQSGSSVLLTRPHAGRLHPQLEDVRARGDVEAAIVGVAEGQVGGAHARPRLAGRLRQMQNAQCLALSATRCGFAPGGPPLVVYRLPFVSTRMPSVP